MFPTEDPEAKYVLVDEESESPADTTPAAEKDGEPESTEDARCPDVLYRVQYKDFGGEIQLTKELSAPYTVKKTTFNAGGIPIIEILYSVTIWYPQIYRKGKGLEKKEVDSNSKAKEDFNERGLDDKSMIIHSQHLIKAVRDVVDYYPGQSLCGETLTIKAPFDVLVHYRNELEAYKLSTTDDITRQHIEVLQKYMRENIGPQIEAEDKNHARDVPVCTFEMLWMLYKPGTDVYATIDGQRAGLVMQSCSGVTEDVHWGEPQPLKLHMWFLNFDGTTVGRQPYEMVIAPFDGEREVLSLKIVPAHFIDRTDPTQRGKLEDRGEKFYSMLLGKQMDYKGYSLIAKQKPKRWLEARVVVDQTAFFTYAEYTDLDMHPAPMLGVDDGNSGILNELQHYNCNCEECTNKRQAASANTKFACYENIDPNTVDRLDTETDGVSSRHRYFLLPRRIMGFDLKEKKWQALDVENCYEPKIRTEAIENLVLPAEKLEIIKGLVHKYTTARQSRPVVADKTWSADPIPNKGEGQIFLLHGPPGGGKTFTAECVAEYTSRPLLALTCGDLGTEETALESNLDKWFKLGERWRCVLLLDEADVYLERRAVNDLTRNGLVSVFLRLLEYYKGILFLTTNRVALFDPAILSRIHVYVGYPPLGLEGRRTLWQQNFAKLERERADQVTIKAAAKRYILSDDVLRDVDWNGREIRNAFQTAVALAEYEAEDRAKRPRGIAYARPDAEGAGATANVVPIELNQSHFERVIDMSNSFKKYLASVVPSETSRAGVGERGDDRLL